jgi:hypothetical protein
MNVRVDVLTAVKTSVLAFWVTTPYGLVVDTSVLEEHTASIFRTEVYFSPEDGTSIGSF